MTMYAGRCHGGPNNGEQLCDRFTRVKIVAPKVLDLQMVDDPLVCRTIETIDAGHYGFVPYDRHEFEVADPRATVRGDWYWAASTEVVKGVCR